MTTATFHQSEDIYRISVDGHAEYNPGGPDIVCSACSLLFCTLMQCLLAEHNAHKFPVFVRDADEETGHYYIKVKAAPSQRATVDGIVDVIASGFALLQAKYPEHVMFVCK